MKRLIFLQLFTSSVQAVLSVFYEDNTIAKYEDNTEVTYEG